MLRNLGDNPSDLSIAPHALNLAIQRAYEAGRDAPEQSPQHIEQVIMQSLNESFETLAPGINALCENLNAFDPNTEEGIELDKANTLKNLFRFVSLQLSEGLTTFNKQTIQEVTASVQSQRPACIIR